MEFLSRFAPVSHHLKAEKTGGEQVELKDSLKKLSTVVAEMGSNLQTLFSYFDYSGKGTVTTAEFQTGLLALKSLDKKATFSENEVTGLTKFFDSNDTGYINFDEFFNGFTVHDKKFSKTLSAFSKPRIPRRKGSVVLKTAPKIRQFQQERERKMAANVIKEEEESDVKPEAEGAGGDDKSRNGRSRSLFFGLFKRKSRSKSRG